MGVPGRCAPGALRALLGAAPGWLSWDWERGKRRGEMAFGTGVSLLSLGCAGPPAALALQTGSQSLAGCPAEEPHSFHWKVPQKNLVCSQHSPFNKSMLCSAVREN